MTDHALPAYDPALPSPPARVHFIGIGGVSMSGLAGLLQDTGYTITGSDAVGSPVVASLRARGIPVVIGHADPAFAAQADVVVSTRRAELQATSEIHAARANGALIVKRGQLLGMIANPLKSIAVAGTHGKSTTSGMLTIALVALGMDPSYAVGATLPGLDGNTASGAGEHMVVEADEFDRSFLWLRPEVAIITSVSFDHPDIYADQQDYDGAFTTFARQTKAGGTLVIAADEPGCQRVVGALGDRSSLPFSIVTFGESNEADWRVERNGDGWTFHTPGGQALDSTLLVPGTHNARNAIAAIAALNAIGHSPAEASQAVARFTGVGRRFEHKGTVRDIDVVDDYAHHPDEIAAVVAAARMRYPDRRVVVVHQPHTYSRTKTLLAEFAKSLDLADEVVLLSIYPGGEADDLGISSGDLLNLLQVPAQAATGPEEASARAVLGAQEGDVILTLGAGDITRTGALILEQLAARDAPVATKARRAHARPEPAVIQTPDAPQLKVMRDASMSMYTTMRLGGPADFLARAPTPDDVIAASRWAADEGLPVTVIGGGSNLLVGDEGIRGLVIVARTPGERAGKLLDVEDREGCDDRVLVTVGAQAPLSWVGRYCAEHGWAGMDWGVGLPGQIGGATVNNAGAHGTELKDHLVGVDLLHTNGQVERVPAAWLESSYRMTRIKDTGRPRPWIVLRSVFKLPRHDPAELVALADDHAAFRKRTQPTGACSGSTFANPEGDFAGRLLEAADLKGYRLGAMQLSPKHANWVVNTGGGTAREAWALIQHAQAMVHARFGVLLRPEIERLGEPWDEE
ncbi:MAG: UDP-N-acetylmuramate--L-alanine ligase [Chloroflexota bacterium]|nr:UDP-N-acetylmuramate--L-alanine ligase [Chloroflexota bacterium]